jgi:hypothetical protein
MDAKWHGLNITLTIPQAKQPIRAIVEPLVIHAFTVRNKESSIKVHPAYA